MARYMVTVTRVDYGSYTAGYSTIRQATSAATLAAFAFGGHNGAIEVGGTLIAIRRKECQRVSYEPSSRAWSITIRKA